MLNYSIIFDISGERMPVDPLYFGVIVGVTLIAISLCLLKFFKRPSKLVHTARFYSAGIGVGIILIVAILHQMKENRDGSIDAVAAGDFHVAEGLVENFHPMPPSGHDTERFTVQGENFAYSDNIITGGFNNTSSHGGPMKSGLPVRITYFDGDVGRVIVKVEVGHLSKPSLQSDASRQ